MVDVFETAVNAGEETVNAPSSLPLRQEDEFRLINQRLDQLTTEIRNVSKPPQFRTADAVQVGVVILAFIIAVFTAFSLSERISDLRSDGAAMERRINDNTNAAESRIGPKLDKLNDLYVAIIERISHLEGAKMQAPK